MSYTLTQTASVIDATLVKSATYVPKAFITVANITARNAIATADKESGKVVRVLDDGSGNVAYYSWNSSGSTWDNAYFPVADGSITSTKLDTDLYNEIFTPTYESETTVTQEITTLPSTALKSSLSATLSGNTQTPYDSYTKLLMRFEGADGSTTFTDATGKTVTPSGNAQIDTAQYRFGSSSGLFDGTGDYLTVTDANNDLDIGTSDFCIEFWYRPNSFAVAQGLFDFRQASGTDVAPGMTVTTGGVVKYETGGAVRITGSTLATGTWYHIAIARSSGVTKMFINGGQVGSSYTDANNYIAVTGIKFGALYDGGYGTNGWIDDLRISVGTPRYTGNFVPLPLFVLSTDKVIVKAVGVNLFDKYKAIRGYYVSTSTGNLSADANLYTSDYIRVEPNTQYITNGTSGARRYVLLDNNKNVISGDVAIDTFTTTSNSAWVRISDAISAIDNKQFVKGSVVPSTYEAYTETSAIVPVELKDVPVIADTFDCNTGKYIKNTGKYTLVSGDITALDTSPTNIDSVGILLSKFAGVKAQVNAPEGSFKVDRFAPEVDLTNAGTWNLTSSAWKWGTSDTYLYLFFPKGTYANLAAAQSALAGTQIVYQLATPVETEYWQNILTSEPSGTIYCYPFINDYDFYDGGCVVTNASYSISSLESVNIVNKVDGSLTPVALSTCTVAANGLSFTSTALSSEDLVDFGYTHRDMSTIPDLTYSYASNLKGTVDGNRQDIALLDDKIEQAITQERSRLQIATVTLGTVSATSTFVVFVAPYACDLVDVKICNKNSVSASDTDYWTVAVVDKGSAGSGTDTIASRTTKTTGGAAMTAYDAWDVGLLDGTYSKLTAGDVVTLVFTKTASATTLNEAFAVISYIAGN